MLSGVSERRRGWSVGRGVYSSRTGGGIVWGRSPCTSRPLDGWGWGEYSSLSDTGANMGTAPCTSRPLGSEGIVDLEIPPRTSRPLAGGGGGLQHVCIEYLQIYCYCLYFKVDHEDNVADGRSLEGS